MHRRAIVNRHGFGDVLNPTAGTQLDCGLFAGGVFQPACWCLQYPSLCQTLAPSTYQAAQGIANPGLLYEPIATPVAPGAPANIVQPVSSGGVQAEVNQQALIDSLTAQAQAETDAADQAAIAQSAANIANAGDTSPPPSSGCSFLGLDCVFWAVMAVGAVLIVSLASPPKQGYR